MKVVTIGAAMRDICITCNTAPIIYQDDNGTLFPFTILPLDTKTEVSQITNAVGGGALNSALSFCKLGFKATALCKIGNDVDGAFIKQQLKKYGINFKHHAVSAQRCTGISAIVISGSGQCAPLVYRGANLTLTSSDISKQAIQNADQLYITSLSGKTSKLLPTICAYAHKYNTPVACNPGTSQLTSHITPLKNALNTISILITNSFEAGLLGDALKIKKMKRRKLKKLPDLLAAPIVSPNGSFWLKDYMITLLNRGPRIVVTTSDKDGVYIAEGSTLYYHPSLSVDVVSTIGAGDAFGSAFVAQLAKGKSIEYAIKAGIINSASVIGALDANSGQLTQKQLDTRIKKMKNKLESFSLR